MAPVGHALASPRASPTQDVTVGPEKSPRASPRRAPRTYVGSPRLAVKPESVFTTTTAEGEAAFGGLRPSEETWRAAFDRLQDRFPQAGPDGVAKALRLAGGHAGRAAAALRSAHARAATTGAAAVATAATVQGDRVIDGVSGTAGRSGATISRNHPLQERDTVRDDDQRVAAAAVDDPWHIAALSADAPVAGLLHPEPVPSREDEDELKAAQTASLPSQSKPPKPSPVDGSTGLCGKNRSKKCSPHFAEAPEDPSEALSREGVRLRRELDAALMQARTERYRGDAASRWASEPPSVLGNGAISARAQIFLAEASAAALSGAPLLSNFEASRDEGQKLKRELQSVLEAGADAAAVASERERLCKELELSFTQGAMAAASARAAAAVAAAVATTDRRRECSDAPGRMPRGVEFERAAWFYDRRHRDSTPRGGAPADTARGGVGAWPSGSPRQWGGYAAAGAGPPPNSPPPAGSGFSESGH
eukprot:TRINITY_DN12253_c0_g1_i2.p1 TRINITY_DN12253_c0_g1~~TRINITY_DN12253_c0_g1_i2.p1  ORF type:complete len:479 (+),score=75.75 TRINITY_DN12253_c0_g1_i2:139-1575(+)